MSLLEPSFPLTIYYDASCPLCRQEMHALRDFDRDDRLRLVDCSLPDFRDEVAERAGVTREQMMRLIRARDAEGRWFVGVDVFVIAYRAAGLDAVARLWENHWLRPAWNRLYPWVARNRMWLSRVGFTRPFNRWVRWAAAREQRRSQACHDGQCMLD
ncbi:thiol-disulfide oxidoreductase DCC family protein [Arenimonas sp.]|uniref:thiol-disulfide oxidoreductase DCC family protein n=1 Tax=Arenimonas sp. TaxID=1872635 RepID=UPI0039E21935